MDEPTVLLKTVEEIAREAGGVLMEHFGKIRQITYKGIGDIVTEADKASEKLITERLQSEFPDHAVFWRGIWHVGGKIRQLLGYRSSGRNYQLCCMFPNLRCSHSALA